MLFVINESLHQLSAKNSRRINERGDLGVRFIGLFVATALFSTPNFANDNSAANTLTSCNALLTASGRAKTVTAEDLDALTERHGLEVLFQTGDDSFIHQHPWLLMSAPQRILHLINYVEPREVTDPRTGFGMRIRYPFFSDALDLTDGYFIIGQMEGIEALVANIEEAADGKSTGFHVPLLLGPPGTGKSRILELLRSGLKNGTAKIPEFYAYTFEWVGLENFPELKGSLPPDFTNEKDAIPFPDPINDSPFTLLPEEVQDAILSQHKARVVEVVGRTPRPKRELSPKSKMIRDAILKKAQADKGQSLTPAEQVAALSQHVRIKRLFLGTQETSPILANQGPEPKVNRLFGSPNPLVRFKRSQRDPFAVDEGVVAMANQGVIFWDELLKNESSLLGQLLNYFSSGKVEASPATSIPVDVYNIAASNTEDVPRILERDPDSPLLSRGNKIPWNYLIQPDEIGREILIGMSDVRIRQLGSDPDTEFREISGAGLLDLFPERQVNQPIESPRGRYAVVLDGDEDTGVYVGPHSLEFMSYVVLLSRLNFDPTAVKTKQQYPMVQNNDAIFASPVVRLRVLTGQMEATQAQLENLAAISEHSGEGEYGMEHRDVERWWGAVVAEAKKSSNSRTITPSLMYETLVKLTRKKKILPENPELRERIIIFAMMVFQEFVAPAMKEDLNLAFARSEGRDVIDQIYDEMLQEIHTLSTNPDANHYHSRSANERRPIDRERFKAIGAIYQQMTGRGLSIQEIATWQMFNSRFEREDGRTSVQRNPGLIRAIAAYQTEVVLRKESMNVQRLLDVASGHVTDPKPNEQARAGELTAILRDELGYNLHSAHRALQFLSSLRDYEQSKSDQASR